ncbi:Cell division protein FtsI [Peptidoglycan synthetase] [uncultured Rubrobacteraceae bacterium]|uniref:Cell division protein FtsI [Peptidoglycan synthetase] n=1 Tax=uncultured Rubrobacteraceae bacterium TaxID=349277 RepID=A0A6J4Q9R9_9ACTN|nr:Cell division protein FtsI [Peptidoglycan synthetase] [uncultured Rubrobacteraceae bacterium]
MFVVSGLLLGGRAVHISLTEDEDYRAFAAEQSWDGTQSVPPTRGSIVSADGRDLATSLEVARVVAAPYQIEDPGGTARGLRAVIGPEANRSVREIRAALSRRDSNDQLMGYSVVATGIKPETAARVQDEGFVGITTAPDTERIYPNGSLASQLVGHASAYGEAFGGVEARFDETLKSGKDVQLTIDSAVQQELQKALGTAVEKSKAKGAVGVVMRVDDGSIVALANTPSYDNNDFDEVPIDDQRDRVLTDPYEPGSTFKAFTVASALEDGAVTPSDKFIVPDHLVVAGHTINDSEPHATEVLTPGGVLEHSSNVGATKVAQEMGGRKLYDYIRAFGFGSATGVDLWGENLGDVPAYEDWSGVSIGNIPFGQGFTVTPLQLVSGYATLINGGYRVTPHVAEQEGRAERGPRVISEKTSAIVRGMLQGVVDDGSGHFAQISGYSVAGKTGTSQKVDPETGTYGADYVASFMGFAPATDPEYVMLAAVDEPRTSYWGEVVAVPAFREVMSFTLGYFNVPPDRKGFEAEEPLW